MESFGDAIRERLELRERNARLQAMLPVERYRADRNHSPSRLETRARRAEPGDRTLQHGSLAGRAQGMTEPKPRASRGCGKGRWHSTGTTSSQHFYSESSRAESPGTISQPSRSDG